MLTKINNMYQNRFISKASAKLLLFSQIYKFLKVILTKIDVFSEIWGFCAVFSLNLFAFPHNKVLVSLAACSVLRRYALSIILTNIL